MNEVKSQPEEHDAHAHAHNCSFREGGGVAGPLLPFAADNGISSGEIYELINR